MFQLITGYGNDATVTSLVDKYEFNIVVESNPDGYVYTWTQVRIANFSGTSNSTHK